MQAHTYKYKLQLSAISLAIATLVAACGGGGGGGSGGGGSPQGSASSAVSVSGAAVKGPVANAKVCFYELLTTGKGEQLACTNTSAEGSYSLNLSYAGGVFMEATGGTYTDETTGLNTTLTTPLTSVGTIAGNGSVVVATPLTTLAVNQVIGNLTTVNFTTAATNIGTTFGVTGSISTTIPNVTIGSNSSYGAALVGISKMMTGGTTLSSILDSSNLTSLQQNHTMASLCVVVGQAANSTSPSIEIANGQPGQTTTLINITEPNPNWRSMLATVNGTSMGCLITQNNPLFTALSCPVPNTANNATLYAGLASATATFPSLPLNTDLLAAGKRIQIKTANGDNRIWNLETRSNTAIAGLPSNNYCPTNLVSNVSLAGSASIVLDGMNISAPFVLSGNTTNGIGILPVAGTINISGNTLTINQNQSQPLGANWQSFSIGSGNTAIFNQTSNSSSIAVNRVTGNNQTQLLNGTLQSNGQPFSINPNGVTKGTKSSIRVSNVIDVN